MNTRQATMWLCCFGRKNVGIDAKPSLFDRHSGYGQTGRAGNCLPSRNHSRPEKLEPSKKLWKNLQRRELKCGGLSQRTATAEAAAPIPKEVEDDPVRVPSAALGVNQCTLVWSTTSRSCTVSGKHSRCRSVVTRTPQLASDGTRLRGVSA